MSDLSTNSIQQCDACEDKLNAIEFLRGTVIDLILTKNSLHDELTQTRHENKRLRDALNQILKLRYDMEVAHGIAEEALGDE